MSEYRFTNGNLIILYAIHSQSPSSGMNRLPDYINERVKVCLDMHRIIIQSKPDGNKTVILIVGNQPDIEYITETLVKAGVDLKIIARDHHSKNVTQCFDQVKALIKTRANPPYLYFIGSVWLREIYDAVVLSRLNGYRVQFEGALDHRPVKEVEEEKALNVPKKGLEHYKRKAKDKAIDLVLNRMFPEGNDKS
ncbi:MAG TPA: hypothetical protein VKA09_11230 [Nitrososphaeraceae archaeon]|nr:hypothetical protein [Nitrososphaeraceae archaeon]